MDHQCVVGPEQFLVFYWNDVKEDVPLLRDDLVQFV